MSLTTHASCKMLYEGWKGTLAERQRLFGRQRTIVLPYHQPLQSASFYGMRLSTTDST